jgi:hypothetical protein
VKQKVINKKIKQGAKESNQLISNMGRLTSCMELFTTLNITPTAMYLYNGGCILHKIQHR